MASLLESVAVFDSRLAAVGLDAAVGAAIKATGISTLAQLAFCCAYVPGAGDDAVLVRYFETALARAATPRELASFRRLFYEAHTLAISELKQKAERNDESAPRRLPAVERATRLQQQQARLNGIVIEGSLDPSNALVDEVFSQREDYMVRWLSVDKCTMRSQELQGVKRESTVRTDSSGKITIQTVDQQLTADVSSEYRVRLALQRRALAYDQLGLIAYDVHEAWSNHLYQQLFRVPPDGYSAITMQQALQADRELWIRMAEATRSGVAPRLDGSRPLEAAMLAMRGDAAVAMLLMPLPRRATPPPPAAPGTSLAKQVSAVTDENSNKRKADAQQPGGTPPKKVKGKGKGKEKGSGKGRVMSHGPMKGFCVNNNLGEPLCFAFNLGTCDKAQPGGRCPRGHHQCAKDGCFGPHSKANCPGG